MEGGGGGGGGLKGEEDVDDDDDDFESSSSWEFVSQEEHPATGAPSYFLHPCRTAERMGAMLLPPHAAAAAPWAASSSSSSSSSSTVVEVVPLLSWLSMVLPVVGCVIPPDVYCRMLDDMSSSSSSRASARRAETR